MTDNSCTDIKNQLFTGIASISSVLELCITELESKDKSISVKELRSILYSYTYKLADYLESTEGTVANLSDMLDKFDEEANILAVAELEGLLNRYFVIRAVIEELLTSSEVTLSSDIEACKLDALKKYVSHSLRRIRALTLD
jgi:hypothetical protein